MMMMKKYANGGMAKMRKCADGGMMQMKKTAKKEVMKHESKMHKGVAGRKAFADGGMACCVPGMCGTGRRSMQDYGK